MTWCSIWRFLTYSWLFGGAFGPRSTRKGWSITMFGWAASFWAAVLPLSEKFAGLSKLGSRCWELNTSSELWAVEKTNWLPTQSNFAQSRPLFAWSSLSFSVTSALWQLMSGSLQLRNRFGPLPKRTCFLAYVTYTLRLSISGPAAQWRWTFLRQG